MLAALVIGGILWLFVPDSRTSADLASPGVGTSGDEVGREARAAELIERLERAVETRDAAAAAALTDTGSRADRELRALVATAQDLDLAVFDLRYLSAVAPSAGEAERWGQDALVVDVVLSWQLSGLDAQPSSVEAPLVLADDGRTASFVTARTPAPRVPIWFNDRVSVERPARGLLVLTSRDASETPLDDLATAGVRTVRDALPGWDGRAVIEAAGTGSRFARASGLGLAESRGIAAVTTSSDGTAVRGAPQRVFLNPAVFGPLGAEGQQIVVSHELTHVAVDGASSAMPLWLSEGYADYVALRDTAIPDVTLAAQIISLVRAEGAPDALPSGDQFDGTDPDVGAWYESAWLAARLLADEYGEPALHSFYRRADRDGGTDRAFARLGTTERAFTRDWRAELERLAR